MVLGVMLISCEKDEKKDETGILLKQGAFVDEKDNYKTFFIASGKGIKSGIVLENGKLINHGPTIAKILGIDFKDADGMAEE